MPAPELKSRWGIAAHGALYGRGDGEIDCFRFTHRLLKQAVALGARVYDRTTVTNVRGITFAMIAADLVCDAYLGRESPDAALFSFGRGTKS